MTGMQRHIADHLREYHHRSWIDMDTVYDSTGKSPGAVKRVLKKLSSDGVVEVSQRDGSDVVRLTPRGRRYLKDDPSRN